MKLLAFETATEGCSVALWLDGDVHERFELAPRRHAELSLPWAGELLAEAGIAKSQLDAIAVGRGPGAFTGVRLAIAIGQGIAFALGRPIVPVSTLAALAMQAPGTHVVAALDARMNEVYSGAFALRDGEAFALGVEAVGAPELVQLPPGGEHWHGIGTGFSACAGALRETSPQRWLSIDAGALPRAGDVARLAARAFARGEALAPERVEPAYLRNHVALTLVEQQQLRTSR